MPIHRYKIEAGLLCHDVRLNTRIQVLVDLDHQPTKAEAERLLWPVADQEVARNFCEDCPYELYYIDITEVDQQEQAGQ